MAQAKEFKVGDEVKVVKLNQDASSGKGKYIGITTKINSVSSGKFPYYLDNIGYWFSDDELELAEQWLTKEEALKAAIDGAKIVSEFAKHPETHVFFDGRGFKYYNGAVDKVQDIRVSLDCRWKLWTPPTPKPKFSIGQTVKDNDGDDNVIESMEFKYNRWIYQTTCKIPMTYNESELSEVPEI
jgi:hypothetical protein